MGRFLLFSLCFVLILLAVDQSMKRLPERTGAVEEVRQFYLDFRSRLLQLPPKEKGEAAPSTSVVYIYADAEGSLQFADSLEDVPQRFRAEARPMER